MRIIEIILTFRKAGATMSDDAIKHLDEAFMQCRKDLKKNGIVILGSLSRNDEYSACLKINDERKILPIDTIGVKFGRVSKTLLKNHPEYECMKEGRKLLYYDAIEPF